jgi:hypothetical protein
MWKRSEIRWPGLALLLIVIAITVRPSDFPWFFDMSYIFQLALHFNATPSHVFGLSLPFTPAPYGFIGTHGVRYGPLPIWIDQLFLACTHSLILMGAIRAFFVAGLIAFALIWLMRLMGMSPWLAVVIMLSPWLWYYSRQLWDNSLNLPVTALLFVSYGQFLQSRKPWLICLAAVCAASACLIHLSAVPIVAAIAFHAIVFEWRSIAKVILPLGITCLAMFAISIPYLHYLITAHTAYVPTNGLAYQGWLFPLFGAQHFTTQQIGYLLEEDWSSIMPAPLNRFFAAACIITCIGYLASWTGMIFALPKAARAFRPNSDTPILEKLCLVALIILVFQIVFDGIEHVYLYPHYYNTTWIIYVLFIGLAFTSLPQWFKQSSLLTRLALPAYAASLLFVQIIVTWQIAKNSGMKGNHYNAVLSNQIEVANELARFSPDSPIDMRVDYWRNDPTTLRVMRQMIAPTPAGPTRSLVVRFRDAFPGDAKIIVENYPLNNLPASESPQLTGPPY